MPQSQLLTDDRSPTRLTPEVQQSIIALAARLQEADRESLTTQDLTRLAAEAGVQAKYVQEAMVMLGESPKQMPHKESSSKWWEREFQHAGLWFWITFMLVFATGVLRNAHNGGQGFHDDSIFTYGFAAIAVFAAFGRSRLVGAFVGVIVAQITITGYAGVGRPNEMVLPIGALLGIAIGWLSQSMAEMIERRKRLQL